MKPYYPLFFFVLLLLPAGDALFIRRRRRSAPPGRVIERRSLPSLRLAILLGMAAAVPLMAVRACRIGWPPPVIAAAAVLAMLLGMALRWAAMARLGSRFSPHVEIGESHELVTDGIFRRVRHPAYAGILAIFLGVGMTYANWLSLAAVAAGAAAGVMNRVRIEEKALRGHFGAAYEEYCRRSRRFIPFVL